MTMILMKLGFLLVGFVLIIGNSVANAQSGISSLAAPDGTTYYGEGACIAQFNGLHDFAAARDILTVPQCDTLCRNNDPNRGLRGFVWDGEHNHCICFYEDGLSPAQNAPCPAVFNRFQEPGRCNVLPQGSGPVASFSPHALAHCYAYDAFPGSQGTGDPHFRTWKNEHFEFHGQCDVVMTSVKNFADQKDVHLDIHLRTKMVRFWSYIERVAIRIGNDILEIEGLSDFSLSYWINYEYKGELTDLAGLFPVSINDNTDRYTIDLGSVFPGQKIEIKTYKEFVGVKIVGASPESFGTAVGITGDYHTGNTYARDQSTILHDFNELGNEWQVMPSDGKLFHSMSSPPQFPEKCWLPEDPHGQRKRRLSESMVTEEDAEKACAGLKDDFDRKGCIYDILATQDIDMVGAY